MNHIEGTFRLTQIDDCIFDAVQLRLSHGYEDLDVVAQESFVNHIHIDGLIRISLAEKLISEWTDEMRSRWPHHQFRIYFEEDPEEVTVRFHRVREGLPNWYDSGLPNVRVIIVSVA